MVVCPRSATDGETLEFMKLCGFLNMLNTSDSEPTSFTSLQREFLVFPKILGYFPKSCNCLPYFNSNKKVSSTDDIRHFFFIFHRGCSVVRLVRCPTVEMIITKVRSIFRLQDIFLRIVERNYNQKKRIGESFILITE